MGVLIANVNSCLTLRFYGAFVWKISWESVEEVELCAFLKATMETIISDAFGGLLKRIPK